MFADVNGCRGSEPPAATGAVTEHELVPDPEDGLLYCTRCPMVAYDLADAATDPECPMRLDSLR